MDLEQRVSEERKKWEKPFQYEPFPRMLVRGIAVTPGWESCIVANEREEQDKLADGWQSSLTHVNEHKEKLAADVGVAAAERAAADRKLSDMAQAEAAKADAASDGQHLGEIPETPLKKKPLRKTLTSDDLLPPVS